MISPETLPSGTSPSLLTIQRGQDAGARYGEAADDQPNVPKDPASLCKTEVSVSQLRRTIVERKWNLCCECEIHRDLVNSELVKLMRTSRATMQYTIW